MEEKTELYKVRTISERFAATNDFVSENWRVLAKNILPVGLILSLPVGICMHYVVKCVLTMLENPMLISEMLWAEAGLFITILLFSLFICGTTGAILHQYAQKTLTPETGWAGLKKDFFPIIGKILIQALFIGLIVTVFTVIISVASVFLNNSLHFFATVDAMTQSLTILVMALLIIFIPSFFLMQYPVYFEQASAWKGITKGFKWGFKYWGSTFLSTFLGYLILWMCSYIVTMPYIVYLMFHIWGGGGGWIGYILSIFMSIPLVFLQPLYIIFVGFQYTSIASRLSCDN